MDETLQLIMKIPKPFIDSLKEYFEEMKGIEKICQNDIEYLVMAIFPSTFGYSFLKASFGENLDQTTGAELLVKFSKRRKC